MGQRPRRRSASPGEDGGAAGLRNETNLITSLSEDHASKVLSEKDADIDLLYGLNLSRHTFSLEKEEEEKTRFFFETINIYFFTQNIVHILGSRHETSSDENGFQGVVQSSAPWGFCELLNSALNAKHVTLLIRKTARYNMADVAVCWAQVASRFEERYDTNTFFGDERQSGDFDLGPTEVCSDELWQVL